MTIWYYFDINNSEISHFFYGQYDSGLRTKLIKEQKVESRFNKAWKRAKLCLAAHINNDPGNNFRKFSTDRKHNEL
ncbi:MAG: hypothetical protein CVV64_13530 [Candidatus Wallbacteria bacterium HGW-Wallbacteria-1]|uniref:Uncharacterized protein n=1 Tax=Candidatus Wallbacteria bacterium HGW-Wallbacteria-1 TaxID=2013854 RepID=A0A2N1PMK9_9BACT|nr:MAG: hypothetical protein CVV64_13530 [Candidatus Wallbacteria bacterium HGW-Wallbacteria-1]